MILENSAAECNRRVGEIVATIARVAPAGRRQAPPGTLAIAPAAASPRSSGVHDLARPTAPPPPLWGGPVAACAMPPVGAARVAVARKAADLGHEGRAVAIAGGGDTVAALRHAGAADDFTYVSTAGGAFLEWLEGKVLPGIKALED